MSFKLIILPFLLFAFTGNQKQNLSCYEKEQIVKDLDNDCDKIELIEKNLSCCCFVSSISELADKAQVNMLSNMSFGTLGITFINLDTLQRDLSLIKKNLNCK